MNVLVACEFSGVVRDALIALGHNAISCDLLDTEAPGPHYKGDVLDILDWGWDMMIAFPPCTYLCRSGIHWNSRVPGRDKLTEEALTFVKKLLSAPIHRIALENPIGVISTRIRKPDQVVQPYWFGDDAKKTTCLWLKNLPMLVPTNMLPGDDSTIRANQTPGGWNKLGPSKDRWRLRSTTYPGLAQAMASQWAS